MRDLLLHARPVILLGSLVIPHTFAAPGVAAALERPLYLQLGTPTSMIVCWRTDTPTDSRVHYGSSPGVLDQEVSTAAVVTDHCVDIAGLTPATRYYYDVGSTTSVIGGGTSGHYFTTSPATATNAPFTAWVVGDGGTGTPMQQQVMNAMLAEAGSESPTLALYAGDMAYYSGADIEFTNNFFAPYAVVLRNTVLWPSLGNHEGVSTASGDPGPSTGPYYNAFVLPAAAQAGGIASGTEAYYSFDYGNTHFVSLNSYQVSRSPTGPMASWLASDLASTAQDWVIAFFHHPPYTKGSHDSDNAADSGARMVDMRENILPILESGGADVVFTGHSHIYERSMLIDGVYGYGSPPDFVTPALTTLLANGHIKDGGDGRVGGDGRYLKARGISAHGGTVYVVAGNGGQPAAGPGNHPVHYVSETVQRIGSPVHYRQQAGGTQRARRRCGHRHLHPAEGYRPVPARQVRQRERGRRGTRNAAEEPVLRLRHRPRHGARRQRLLRAGRLRRRSRGWRGTRNAAAHAVLPLRRGTRPGAGGDGFLRAGRLRRCARRRRSPADPTRHALLRLRHRPRSGAGRRRLLRAGRLRRRSRRRRSPRP